MYCIAKRIPAFRAQLRYTAACQFQTFGTGRKLVRRTRHGTNLQYLKGGSFHSARCVSYTASTLCKNRCSSVT
eukprot:2603570-Rhodomonas_salina.1